MSSWRHGPGIEYSLKVAPGVTAPLEFVYQGVDELRLLEMGRGLEVRTGIGNLTESAPLCSQSVNYFQGAHGEWRVSSEPQVSCATA